MPNTPAVFVDFPNPVKRHAMASAPGIHQPEHLRIVFGKIQFAERDHDDPSLHAIQITQLEVAAGKLGVPPDAAQQFMNWRHDEKRKTKFRGPVPQCGSGPDFNPLIARITTN